jgi:sugar lactone lactonase YvrE
MAAYLLRIPPAPAVQTLARIGQASAKGISADAAGNVYLAVSAGVTDLILLHSSKDNTIVQLPISRDSYLDMEGLAVSPDGEELYIADQEGIDIYQAPWTGQPQRFAIGFRDCMGIQCYKRG